MYIIQTLYKNKQPTHFTQTPNPIKRLATRQFPGRQHKRMRINNKCARKSFYNMCRMPYQNTQYSSCVLKKIVVWFYTRNHIIH